MDKVGKLTVLVLSKNTPSQPPPKKLRMTEDNKENMNPSTLPDAVAPQNSINLSPSLIAQ